MYVLCVARVSVLMCLCVIIYVHMPRVSTCLGSVCVHVCVLGCVCCKSVCHGSLRLCLGDTRVCDDTVLVFLRVLVPRTYSCLSLSSSPSVHVFACLPTCAHAMCASRSEWAWGAHSAQCPVRPTLDGPLLPPPALLAGLTTARAGRCCEPGGLSLIYGRCSRRGSSWLAG